MPIMKVWRRKDGRKFVTVPKHSGIEEGDYVRISKVSENEEEEAGDDGPRASPSASSDNNPRATNTGGVDNG